MIAVKTALFAVPAVLIASAALAQVSAPMPAPLPPSIAAPRDIPYRGTLKLQVDATDTERHIFRVRETVPVTGGARATLLHPRWLPGYHSPNGRIELLAGLVVQAGGKRVPWTRDTVDGTAFHIDVPAGVTALDIAFQFLSPVEGDEGRVVMTPDMLNLQWNNVALYPAGYFTRQIPIEASLTLPQGWQLGTALETASKTGDTVTFKPVSFETLIDSPIFAGRHFKRLALDAESEAPVYLDIVADRPELLEVKPEQLEAHRNLVRQAYKLYGSHHYDHYDLLLALSDKMGGIGLEHHRSSENGTVPTYFTEWDKNADVRGLLPHEFTHSWNGKFRRPFDLWTANFNVPMQDSLLWVYEGQTQYWGHVLAARSGMITKEQALDSIALTAAAYDNRRGREWRALQDTTNDPILADRRPIPWRSWQRSEDYYSEGQLVWLDADTMIRELSKGTKSLDDFAKAFFGVATGSYVPVTYNFDEVVRVLNTVQPYDWAKFLRTRLDDTSERAPLDGLTRGGYKLIYSDTPSDYAKASETRRRTVDLTYSLGLSVNRDRKLSDVMWEGPAFKAGLTVGTEIVAVNGTGYDGDRLKDVVKASKTNRDPIELIVKNGERFRSIRIDYHDGLRYPRLERVANTPARLDEIFAAKN